MFVNCAINEILQEVENFGLYNVIIVESDNRTSQYKSTQHFNDLHQISNQFSKTVIRIYGFAGHRKRNVNDFFTLITYVLLQCLLNSNN